MDIDNFKAVNDLQGHKAGDDLLHLIAVTMKKNLRTMDTVARLGGDEFAVFMPETKLEQTRIVIDRLQKTLLEVAKNNQWPITFSAGVVCYDTPPQTAGEAIKAADELMYSAKTSGKNKILYEQRSGRRTPDKRNFILKRRNQNFRGANFFQFSQRLGGSAPNLPV
ncbi:MAG: GGDEF domain-containing protein, partial [Candidatus Omnitrophica bacterium]|nr:GGDEF domain-containing protein [Candidatus Omnitrophota bacterium]